MLGDVPIRPLAAEVLARRKTGFRMPLADWLKPEINAPPGDSWAKSWATYLLREFTGLTLA